MMQPSGQRLRAAQRPAAGGAQQQLCGGVYGCQTHLTAARDCDGAKAPARGGGRALRGGACGTLIPRIGSSRQRQQQASNPTHQRYGTVRRCPVAAMKSPRQAA